MKFLLKLLVNSFVFISILSFTMLDKIHSDIQVCLVVSVLKTSY